MKDSGRKAYAKDLQRLDLSRMDSRIKVTEDIGYAAGEDHILDVFYLPDGKTKPVLIDIHGGGFISHDKKVDRLFAHQMALQGFVVFSVNYRLAYPEYNVFHQIEDLDKAITWIRDNAGKYGADPEEMHIAGHSSAAVLATAMCLISVDKDMAEAYGSKSEYAFKGLILNCGLMHFYKNSIAYWGMRNMVFPKGYTKNPRYRFLLFEKNDKLKDLPKTVLITNEKDELKAMTYYFKKVLDSRGVKNLLIDDGSEGHMGIIFTPYSEDNSERIGKISRFLL